MHPATAALLGPAEIRRLAAELGVRPAKTLGQNFVHDANTVRRIVAAADLRASDHVLEVGPGLGSLTLALADRVAAVTAVEVDLRLADALPATIAAHRPERVAAVRVLSGDALQLTAAALTRREDPAAPHDPTALVANLPYNVAVPVLLHLLAEVPTIRRVLVMVQAEVADRLAAPPGNRTYGAPSVKLAWYGEARRAGQVPRSVFWPVPNVDSALVSVHCPHPARTGDRAAVFACVDAAFGQRRKTLRSALAGWAGSAAVAEQVLRTAGVAPGLRGEALKVEQYIAIAAARAVMDAQAGE